MPRLVLISLGGALGTAARYLIGTGLARALGPAFPWGTLTVNLVGSFLLGSIMEASIGLGAIGPDLRAVLATGVMGGFTTYSSFNYETLSMLRGGAGLLAVGYVGLTLVGCLAGGVLGVALVRAVPR